MVLKFYSATEKQTQIWYQNSISTEKWKKIPLWDHPGVEAFGGRDGSQPPWDTQVGKGVIEAEIKYWHWNEHAWMGRE